jgi:tetratricopeptide (TPR) repeat protein
MVTIEEALLQLDIGRVDEAAILVKQAMGESADSTVVEYVRALVSAQRGQLGEARRSLEAVLEVEPGHVRARLNRCSVSMLLEDMHLALDDANELLSLYPNLDIARLRRCEILMTLGEWSEAELEIRNLLERKPHHSPALTHLGRTLVALERTDEALPYLDEAIRLDQTQAEGWYQRGLFYLEQGTIGAAIDDFDATTKADPEHLDALLHLAAIHHESNNSAGALAAWRRVLDVVPDHRLARIRLEELSTSEIVNQEI